MSEFNTLDKADVAGKRVLVRCDLNVPMKDGAVTDMTRIERSAETVRELVGKGAKVILMTHLGRPKGEVKPEFTVKPVADAMGTVLGQPVAFAEDCIGPKAAEAVAALADGQVLMLENLRFHKGEEKNDSAFIDALAANGEVYVSDAFSTSHRAHASTEGLAHRMPAFAGRLMAQELEALTRALENPLRPTAAVVGGAKVSTKLDVLGNLVEKVDVVIIGGGMANTFLFAQGKDVGSSLCEKDMADTAREIMAKAEKSGCAVLLPQDVVVATKFEANAPNQTVSADAVPSDQMILDAGPEAVESARAKVATCKTLLWNGPLGAFEIKPFDAATNALAQAVAELTTNNGLLSVAGGGDTVAALANAGVQDKFSYVSTAGGAFLEWIEGKTLPGVAALRAS